MAPKKWTPGRIRAIARRVDALNTKAEKLIETLRGNEHPLAIACADELDAECVVLTSARAVVEQVIEEYFYVDES